MSNVDGITEITSTEYGTLQLRKLSDTDANLLLSLQKQDLSPRELVTQIIHHQLNQPNIELDIVKSWPDEFLLDVVINWAKDNGWPIPSDVSSLEEFEIIYVQYCKQYRTEKFTHQTGRFNVIGQDFAKLSQIPIVPIVPPNISGLADVLNKISSMDSLANATKALNSIQFVAPELGGLADVLEKISTKNSLADFTKTLSSIQIAAPQLSGLADVLEKIAAKNPLADFAKTLNASMDNITGIFKTQIDLLTSPFDNLLDVLGSEFGSGRLVTSLPRPSKIKGTVQQVEKVANETGYGFSLHVWRLKDIAVFYQAHSIDARVRTAVVTKRLLKITRSAEFRDNLSFLFMNSSTLSRRWKILQAALEAHSQRNYVMSIPVLLAQLEGILGDALILNDKVIRKGNKLFERGANGKVRLHNKGKYIGKPIEIHGLQNLMEKSELRKDVILNQLADLIADRLIPNRNSVLHGRSVNYAQAQLSLHILLAIWILAKEIDAFENKV